MNRPFQFFPNRWMCNVSYGDLADYISDKVSRLSLVENSKGQTPVANATIEDWKKLKFNK